MSLTYEQKHHIDQQITEAFNAPFQGWDFSYLEQFGGAPSTPLPWSYRVHVENAIRNADSLLDMGTGGGEFLASLKLPRYTAATEAYPPNVELATRKLTPLGVDVRGIPLEGTVQDHYPLPFDDAAFDVVINRHESYQASEVLRVLKSGGLFITQQVGERSGENLRMIFGTLDSDIPYAWNAANAARLLTDTGFSIEEQQEDTGFERFFDIRALAYYMRIIEWEFPAISLETHRERFYAMARYVQRHGYFDKTTHHFLIVARKSG